MLLDLRSPALNCITLLARASCHALNIIRNIILVHLREVGSSVLALLVLELA